MLRHKIEIDLNVRFFILQAAIASICCVGVSFISPVLMGFQYGPLEIGVALTLAALANMCAKPLWGYLHDKYSCSRQTVLGVILAGCLFFALLVLSGGQKLLTRIAISGIAVTISSMVSFVDSWAMRLISEGYELNYGATRSGGSLMYALTAAGFGVVMNLFGAKPGIGVLALLYVVLILAARNIPNPQKKLKDAPDKTLKDGVRYLLNNRPYVALVLTYFVGIICICASDGFLSLRIAELGGSDAHIGAGMFVQAMSEIPIMLLYSRIKARLKVAPHVTIAISFVFYFIKCVLLGLAPSVEAAILITLLNGLSFALFVMAIVDYILMYVDPSYLSTAYLLFSALGSGLGAALGNYVDGAVAEAIGVGNMMLVMSVTALLAAAIVGFWGKSKAVAPEAATSSAL